MHISPFENIFIIKIKMSNQEHEEMNMSGKTKIVVLHMKELIYTGIFAVLGILFVILLVMMFLPKEESTGNNTVGLEESVDTGDTVAGIEDITDSTDISASAETTITYIPGIYTTELVLGEQSIDVEVIVDKTSITSIRMINLDEAITTMYPLLQPTFDSICEQVYELQTLEGVTYSTDSKYTSLVLLEAIGHSLDKATAE